MRGALLAIVAVLAAEQASAEDGAWTENGPKPAPKGIELNIARALQFSRERNGSSDGLLRTSRAPQLGARETTLPDLEFGRFRASFGGVAGKHVQLGTYEFDTHDFLGSRISGSIDGRGARIMFTVPLH